MTVISVRIPEKTKKEMKKAKINWSEYIREAIEEKIEEERKKQLFSSVDEILKDVPPAPKGFASKSVRKDRDG